MALFGKKNNEMNVASELNISVKNEGTEYTFVLEGRLDTITSPSFEKKINEIVEDAEKLIFDLSNLQYISSAGLRVLLGATQQMEEKGKLIVRNPSQPVREVFDLTGFSRLFIIE